MTRLAEARPGGRAGGPAGRWQVPVLMYHEISDTPGLPRHLAVRPETFAEQLGWLRESGYTGLSAGDLAAALRDPAPALPGRPVVLTFDDGFADFDQHVLPLLRRFGFTATLYVTTGWMADAPPELAAVARRAGPRPPGTITWNQLAAAAAAGVEVGAHTITHPQLDQIPAGRLRAELGDSKGLLEDRLGVAVTGMSYPFGYWNAAVRDAAAAAGYRHACAVGNRVAASDADPMAIPRLTMSRTTTKASFGHAIAGRRLPPEFIVQRTLSRGYSVVRRGRAAMNMARQ